ncbi:MAG TPA: hypothetical protein DCY12_10165 [Candidatus Atribacteria bacterium]|nr:hypothetical protein [Candidatus Atribacteria bacterium]HCU21568.1 hypothetical protein [Candidatus Atribacteria bacterium]
MDNLNIKRNSFDFYTKIFSYTGFSPDINRFTELKDHFVLKHQKLNNHLVKSWKKGAFQTLIVTVRSHI